LTFEPLHIFNALSLRYLSATKATAKKLSNMVEPG